MLAAQIDAAPGLTASVSQLDASARERTAQAGDILNAVSPGDQLLLLDTPGGAGDDAYKILTQNGGWTDGFRPGPGGGYTFPAARPRERRDVILFRGNMTAADGQVARSTVSGAFASTHRPVLVRFTR